MNLGPQTGRASLPSGIINDFATNVGRVPTIWRIQPSASGSTITGFQRWPFANAEFVILRNDAPVGNLMITHLDARSEADNRVTCLGGTTAVIPPGGIGVLLNDESELTMVAVSGTPTGPSGVVAPTVLATVTSNTVLSTANVIAKVDPTSAAFTLTLPAASTNAGLPVIVKNVSHSVNIVTLLPAGSDTVEALASQQFSGDRFSCHLVSDGVSDWMVI